MIWIDIPGYEGLYRVSDEGEVFSVHIQRVMRPSTDRKSGHKRVILYRKPDKPRTATVHTLVKNSFDGPTPPGLQVCHNNGRPFDNRRSNLRFGTPTDNMMDKQLHGTDHQRSKKVCPRNHDLVPPNLQVAKLQKGWRSCRACHQARSDIHNGSPLSFQEASDLRYRILMGVTDG